VVAGQARGGSLLGCSARTSDTGAHSSGACRLRRGVVDLLTGFSKATERHDEDQQEQKERSEQRELHCDAASVVVAHSARIV
jgi:hypothetical protein